MGKSRFTKALFALMLVLLLALAACSGNDNNNDANEPNNNTNSESENNANNEDEVDGDLYSIEDFSTDKTNAGEAIEGGEATFGLVSDTAFAGILNYNFYSGAPDAEILDWFDEPLLTIDENYDYTQDGAATFEAHEDGRTFTFTIRDDVYWHDGEPLKAEDWAFAFEVIGHPDYEGYRYGNVSNIEGMEEYHAGETDTISGVEVIDEKTLKLTYVAPTPSLLNSGIWPYAMAKHIFGDMEVADMEESPEIRENPIGIGPFKVDSIVPGESVTLSKFEDYWRGEPNLDKLTIKVVNPDVVAQAMETEEIDLVDNFPADQYVDHADMENVEFIGKIDPAYTYIGFKFGLWDKDNRVVDPDPDAKMNDVNLRKAMWLAVDNDAVGKRFYNGLRWNATTLIPPSHPMFHDETNPGVTYDPEAAEALLDEAGYEKGADGFRTTPDGEELVINFISMTGGDIAQPLANYYVQSWENIGLNVELSMEEFNSFYERVGDGGNDDPEVDVYMGAWSVSSDADPTGLYGPNAPYNFPRWQNDENERLLEEGVSEESLDLEHRQEVYKEWQQLMVEEIPVFPTLYRAELVSVNDRIVNYSIGTGSDIYRYQIGVTE